MSQSPQSTREFHNRVGSLAKLVISVPLNGDSMAGIYKVHKSNLVAMMVFTEFKAWGEDAAKMAGDSTKLRSKMFKRFWDKMALALVKGQRDGSLTNLLG